MSKRVLFFLFLLTNVCYTFAHVTCTTERHDDDTQTIFLQFQLKPNDFVLKESIDLSVDHPDIALSEWTTDAQAVEQYKPSLKDTKKVFENNFTLSLHATSDKPFAEIDSAHLYLSYYSGLKKQTIQKNFPLIKKTIENGPVFEQEAEAIETVEPTVEKVPKPEKKLSFSQKLSDLVAKTDSFWIRIFLVLLLGLLMSLTPCIYPMIPITVGILQSQGSKSVAYNFLQSLCYTTGIATTFAVLGLTAAFTGQLFGSLMGNPFVIIFLAVFLAYLGLAMFGVCEMYTPRFLNKGADANKAKKSLLSIFLFGAISGTVASPCLSPGLILLLSIVTSIGSKLLGFALLFSFGIGLGIPLLIIGTFSGSLNALPRAGMWMIEVKKLFGFMLFGMAFYFLSNIMPHALLFGLMTLFLGAASLFYFYNIKKSDSKMTKTFKNVVGVVCVVLAVLLAFKTYKAIVSDGCSSESPVRRSLGEDGWYSDHTAALQIAQQENKKLFVDVGAPFCGICKAIDNGLLSDSKVRAAMNQFVNLKIDGSSCPHEISEGLLKKYKVVGFPTYLLIDPHTGDLLARWGSELHDLSPQKFINLLNQQ